MPQRESAACRCSAKRVSAKSSASRCDFGLGLADDEHLLPVARRVQLVANLAMSPLNRSTDSIFSRQVVSSEPIGHSAGRDRGKPRRPARIRRRPMQVLRAAPAAPRYCRPSSSSSARLDQQEPGIRRAGSRPNGPPSTSRGIEHGHFDRVERLQAPLAWRPRSGGSIRPRRRRTRPAPGRTSRGRKYRGCRRAGKTRPACATALVLWKPCSTSQRVNASTSPVWPTVKRRVWRASNASLGVGCIKA